MTREQAGGRRMWGACKRCIGALAAGLTIGAATCTNGPSVDVEATPGTLNDAADRSLADPFRYETWLALGADDEVLLRQGVVDQDRFWSETHFEAPYALRGGPFGDAEPPDPVETIGDQRNLYVKGPAFADLVRTDVDRKGDWLDYDTVEASRAPTFPPHTLLGFAGPDLRNLLELFSSVDEVRPLGTDRVGGDPVAGMEVDLRIGDALAALGYSADPEALDGLRPASRQVVERTLEVPTPVGVWVDDDGYIRRIRSRPDLDRIADVVNDRPDRLADQMRLAELAGFELPYTVEFTYGGARAVELPGM